MQISRRFLLACATAICVTPLMLHAYDNENQLRARQALDAKMKELATQPPPAETSAPPVVVTKPEKAPAKKPAKPAPKPEAKPAKAQPPKETATPAAKLETPQPVPATPAPAPEAPAVVFKEPGQPPKEIPPSTAILVTPGEPARPVTPEVSAPPPSTRVGVPAAPARPGPQTNVWNQPYVQQAPQHPSTSTTHGAPSQPTMNLAPLSGPASSLSATKEQRLEQLLQLYRADQITPQQYHDQRQKILSEP